MDICIVKMTRETGCTRWTGAVIGLSVADNAKNIDNIHDIYSEAFNDGDIHTAAIALGACLECFPTNYSSNEIDYSFPDDENE